MIKQKTTEVVRKTALVDLKSNYFGKDKKSFFDAHLHQLISAKYAMAYNYPNVKVDMMANFSTNGWRTKPSYTFHVWNPSDADYQLFDCYIKIGRLKGLFNPSGSVFVPPDYNINTTAEDFKILSYPEFVGQILNPVEENREDYTDETSPILNSM
jgi:hypothetical protein